jgi:hypothetical protein
MGTQDASTYVDLESLGLQDVQHVCDPTLHTHAMELTALQG